MTALTKVDVDFRHGLLFKVHCTLQYNESRLVLYSLIEVEWPFLAFLF